eukprot:Rhum_TRINITY_DN14312_c8_g1::Rhum_TRINITY_DN14312_c8_g1_i1::g.79306::m.79306
MKANKGQGVGAGEWREIVKDNVLCPAGRGGRGYDVDVYEKMYVYCGASLASRKWWRYPQACGTVAVASRLWAQPQRRNRRSRVCRGGPSGACARCRGRPRPWRQSFAYAVRVTQGGLPAAVPVVPARRQRQRLRLRRKGVDGLRRVRRRAPPERSKGRRRQQNFGARRRVDERPRARHGVRGRSGRRPSLHRRAVRRRLHSQARVRSSGVGVVPRLIRCAADGASSAVGGTVAVRRWGRPRRASRPRRSRCRSDGGPLPRELVQASLCGGEGVRAAACPQTRSEDAVDGVAAVDTAVLRAGGCAVVVVYVDGRRRGARRPPLNDDLLRRRAAAAAARRGGVVGGVRVGGGRRAARGAAATGRGRRRRRRGAVLLPPAPLARLHAVHVLHRVRRGHRVRWRRRQRLRVRVRGGKGQEGARHRSGARRKHVSVRAWRCDGCGDGLQRWLQQPLLLLLFLSLQRLLLVRTVLEVKGVLRCRGDMQRRRCDDAPFAVAALQGRLLPQKILGVRGRQRQVVRMQVQEACGTAAAAAAAAAVVVVVCLTRAVGRLRVRLRRLHRNLRGHAEGRRNRVRRRRLDVCQAGETAILLARPAVPPSVVVGGPPTLVAPPPVRVVRRAAPPPLLLQRRHHHHVPLVAAALRHRGRRPSCAHRRLHRRKTDRAPILTALRAVPPPRGRHARARVAPPPRVVRARRRRPELAHHHRVPASTPLVGDGPGRHRRPDDAASCGAVGGRRQRCDDAAGCQDRAALVEGGACQVAAHGSLESPAAPAAQVLRSQRFPLLRVAQRPQRCEHRRLVAGPQRRVDRRRRRRRRRGVRRGADVGGADELRGAVVEGEEHAGLAVLRLPVLRDAGGAPVELPHLLEGVHGGPRAGGEEGADAAGGHHARCGAAAEGKLHARSPVRRRLVRHHAPHTSVELWVARQRVDDNQRPGSGGGRGTGGGCGSGGGGGVAGWGRGDARGPWRRQTRRRHGGPAYVCGGHRAAHAAGEGKLDARRAVACGAAADNVADLPVQGGVVHERVHLHHRRRRCRPRRRDVRSLPRRRRRCRRRVVRRRRRPAGAPRVPRRHHYPLAAAEPQRDARRAAGTAAVPHNLSDAGAQRGGDGRPAAVAADLEQRAERRLLLPPSLLLVPRPRARARALPAARRRGRRRGGRGPKRVYVARLNDAPLARAVDCDNEAQRAVGGRPPVFRDAGALAVQAPLGTQRVQFDAAADGVSGGGRGGRGEGRRAEAARRERRRRRGLVDASRVRHRLGRSRRRADTARRRRRRPGPAAAAGRAGAGLRCTARRGFLSHACWEQESPPPTFQRQPPARTRAVRGKEVVPLVRFCCSQEGWVLINHVVSPPASFLFSQ